MCFLRKFQILFALLNLTKICYSVAEGSNGCRNDLIHLKIKKFLFFLLINRHPKCPEKNWLSCKTNILLTAKAT